MALIDLDEGVRLMSRVTAPEPEDVRIGARVNARIDNNATDPIVVFDLDTGKPS